MHTTDCQKNKVKKIMYIQAFRGVGRGEWEERKGDCATFVVPCAEHMEIGALRKLR